MERLRIEQLERAADAGTDDKGADVAEIAGLFYRDADQVVLTYGDDFNGEGVFEVRRTAVDI